MFRLDKRMWRKCPRFPIYGKFLCIKRKPRRLILSIRRINIKGSIQYNNSQGTIFPLCSAINSVFLSKLLQINIQTSRHYLGALPAGAHFDCSIKPGVALPRSSRISFFTTALYGRVLTVEARGSNNGCDDAGQGISGHDYRSKQRPSWAGNMSLAKTLASLAWKALVAPARYLLIMPGDNF